MGLQDKPLEKSILVHKPERGVIVTNIFRFIFMSKNVYSFYKRCAVCCDSRAS